MGYHPTTGRSSRDFLVDDSITPMHLFDRSHTIRSGSSQFSATAVVSHRRARRIRSPPRLQSTSTSFAVSSTADSTHFPLRSVPRYVVVCRVPSSCVCVRSPRPLAATGSPWSCSRALATPCAPTRDPVHSLPLRTRRPGRAQRAQAVAARCSTCCCSRILLACRCYFLLLPLRLSCCSLRCPAT